jgi:hypothetical protein
MKNVVLGLFLLFSVSANAGIIDIDVSANTANIGETITVDIVGSGFADFDFFNFDVLFDTSVFSFDPSAIVTDLPIAALVLFGLQAVEVPSVGANFSFFDLLPFTAGAFNISFDLTVIGAGISDFVLSTGLIGQGFSVADPFDIFALPTDLVLTINQTAAQVTASDVPEPGSLMMFAMAMIGFVSYRKFAK